MGDHREAVQLLLTVRDHPGMEPDRLSRYSIPVVPPLSSSMTLAGPHHPPKLSSKHSLNTFLPSFSVFQAHQGCHLSQEAPWKGSQGHFVQTWQGALGKDRGMYLEHLLCADPGSPLSSLFPPVGVLPWLAARGRPTFIPPVLLCPTMSAQPGTCPLGAGPDFSADFPQPWYPWAGNLGHRALGRGLWGGWESQGGN